MTISHITRITCDVPDCTNSVEVEAYVQLSSDDAELDFDAPSDWTAYESCRCPSCNERWQNTRFEVGAKVKVVYAGRVIEGVIEDKTSSYQLHRMYKVRTDGELGVIQVDDWLMVELS